MASRGDPVGFFVLIGMAVSIFAIFKISSIIKKKIEDKAKKLSDYLFSQRQTELTKAVEDKRQLAISELEQKATALRQERQYINSAPTSREILSNQAEPPLNPAIDGFVADQYLHRIN